MFANNTQYPLPTAGSMYDYKFDVNKGEWILWKNSASEYVYDNKLSYSELIIPTKDSICYCHLLNTLLLNGKHVMMTGPTGVGKSVNITGHLQNSLSDRFVPFTLSFSAQTSANQTQVGCGVVQCCVVLCSVIKRSVVFCSVVLSCVLRVLLCVVLCIVCCCCVLVCVLLLCPNVTPYLLLCIHITLCVTDFYGYVFVKTKL